MRTRVALRSQPRRRTPGPEQKPGTRRPGRACALRGWGVAWGLLCDQGARVLRLSGGCRVLKTAAAATLCYSPLTTSARNQVLRSVSSIQFSISLAVATSFGTLTSRSQACALPDSQLRPATARNLAPHTPFVPRSAPTAETRSLPLSFGLALRAPATGSR